MSRHPGPLHARRERDRPPLVDAARRIRRLALAVAAVAAMAGCAGSSRRDAPAEVMVRDSDGSTLEVMAPFPVGCQDDPDRERLALTLARRRNRFHESVYELGVVNCGRTPLVIPEGESLRLHLDDKGTGYRTFGAVDTLRSPSRTIPVAATYLVVFADLKDMAEAGRVLLTLEANGRPIDRCLDHGGIENLKRFIACYPPE